MKARLRAPSLLAALACALACASAPAAPGLAGTSWQLVEIQSMDDTVVRPDEPAKYTFAFAAEGSVALRVDCNRGHGTWRSSEPSRLEFGPVATTRMMCAPGSLDARVLRDLGYVRGYVLRDGRLFLSLMADGGIYVLAPHPKETP